MLSQAHLNEKYGDLELTAWAAIFSQSNFSCGEGVKDSAGVFCKTLIFFSSSSIFSSNTVFSWKYSTVKLNLALYKTDTVNIHKSRHCNLISQTCNCMLLTMSQLVFFNFLWRSRRWNSFLLISWCFHSVCTLFPKAYFSPAFPGNIKYKLHYKVGMIITSLHFPNNDIDL